jgi:hypothetical protein
MDAVNIARCRLPRWLEGDEIIDNSVDVLGIDRRFVGRAHLFNFGVPLRRRQRGLREHHSSGVTSKAIAVDQTLRSPGEKL